MTAEEIEIDWLKKWADYTPDRIAFKDHTTGAEYSYLAIYKLAGRIALHLRNRYQVEKGQRVAVIANNEFEYIPLFYALQRMGAIMVPINFRLTAREFGYILNDCAPTLLIYQREFENILADIPGTVLPKAQVSWTGENSLSEMLSSPLEGEAEVPMAGEFEDPCMILYTSGTTGFPKGALITHKMIFWNAVNTILRLDISQKDVQLAFMPFFHTGGWNVLLTPFVHKGATTVFVQKFEPDLIVRLCDQEKVTILFGVPTILDMMSRAPSFNRAKMDSVRFAIAGGEALPIPLINLWQEKGVPVRQGYGLTEFGPNVFSLNEEDAIRKIGSIGFANFYVKTKVIDSYGEEVNPGEIGELLLKGPMCMGGYWRNPQATEETVKQGWLYTGDLVKFDAEGYFYVVGRKKEMFISGGENVYPVEVEQVISSHPSVREVAVVGVADEKWGEVGKAFISLEQGFELNSEQLHAHCHDKLAKFKIPKHLEIMPELPKGHSGKILKKQLR